MFTLSLFLPFFLSPFLFLCHPLYEACLSTLPSPSVSTLVNPRSFSSLSFFLCIISQWSPPRTAGDTTSPSPDAPYPCRGGLKCHSFSSCARFRAPKESSVPLSSPFAFFFAPFFAFLRLVILAPPSGGGTGGWRNRGKNTVRLIDHFLGIILVSVNALCEHFGALDLGTCSCVKCRGSMIDCANCTVAFNKFV